MGFFCLCLGLFLLFLWQRTKTPAVINTHKIKNIFVDQRASYLTDPRTSLPYYRGFYEGYRYSNPRTSIPYNRGSYDEYSDPRTSNTIKASRASSIRITVPEDKLLTM